MQQQRRRRVARGAASAGTDGTDEAADKEDRKYGVHLLVDFLLNNTADPLVADKKRRTALHFACVRGHVHSASSLITSTQLGGKHLETHDRCCTLFSTIMYVVYPAKAAEAPTPTHAFLLFMHASPRFARLRLEVFLITSSADPRTVLNLLATLSIRFDAVLVTVPTERFPLNTLDPVSAALFNPFVTTFFPDCIALTR